MRAPIQPAALRSPVHALRACILTLSVAALVAASPVASASDAPIVIPSRIDAARVNDDTIGVVFTHEELFHQLVHDMEDALEPVGGLRIVPVMGKNHVQSIYDLLYLKGVDLALVRSDAVEYVKRIGDFDRIENYINSVVKLTEEQLVLIARKSITSVEQLAGRKVAFGVPGSGEYVTGTIAFDTLGVEVEAIEMDGTRALDDLRDGNIAAMVYLLRAEDSIQTGSDLQTALAVARIDESEDLHVVPIAQSEAMAEIYHRSELGHEQLPGLIPAGDSVQSYLVDVILAAYHWDDDHPRHEKSKRFVNALLDGLDSLQDDDFQPGWAQVSIPQTEATIQPLPVVQQILDQREQLALELIERDADETEKAATVERERRESDLIVTRDRLSQLLERKLGDSETKELERLLSELNAVLEPQSTQ